MRDGQLDRSLLSYESSHSVSELLWCTSFQVLPDLAKLKLEMNREKGEEKFDENLRPLNFNGCY